MHVQLDLGYPAISYPDISNYTAMILQYILSIFNLSLAQDKNKEVKYLFYFIVYPFYTNDKLLQVE